MGTAIKITNIAEDTEPLIINQCLQRSNFYEVNRELPFDQESIKKEIIRDQLRLDLNKEFAF
jgi:hypothetical protein